MGTAAMGSPLAPGTVQHIAVLTALLWDRAGACLGAGPGRQRTPGDTSNGCSHLRWAGWGPAVPSLPWGGPSGAGGCREQHGSSRGGVKKTNGISRNSSSGGWCWPCLSRGAPRATEAALAPRVQWPLLALTGCWGALLLPGPGPWPAPFLRRALQLPGPAVSTPRPHFGSKRMFQGVATPRQHPLTPLGFLCSGVFSDGRDTYLIEPQAGAEHEQVSSPLPQFPHRRVWLWLRGVVGHGLGDTGSWRTGAVGCW